MCGVATRERCGAAVIACTRLFIEFFPERTLVTLMGPAHSATGAGPQRVSGAAYTVTYQSADAGRTRDTATFSRAAVNSARPAVSMLVTVASSGNMVASRTGTTGCWLAMMVPPCIPVAEKRGDHWIAKVTAPADSGDYRRFRRLSPLSSDRDESSL